MDIEISKTSGYRLFSRFVCFSSRGELLASIAAQAASPPVSLLWIAGGGFCCFPSLYLGQFKHKVDTPQICIDFVTVVSCQRIKDLKGEKALSSRDGHPTFAQLAIPSHTHKIPQI
jgi:hypothetical protein